MTTAPRPGEEADASNALITVYDAWGRPAKVHKTPPGDANLDGKVDDTDVSIVLANMDEPGGWQQGDFNGDETVTEADWDILYANLPYDVATGTDTLIAEYQYDGLNRRLVKLIPNGDNWDRTDYYYNAGWQLLEERFDDNIAPAYKGDPVTDVKYQYVWGVRYVHSAVLRDENTDIGTDNDCTDPGGSERLYYCNDANFNVTALINTDGTVAERYVYDPYGKVTIYADDWSDTVDWADSKKNIILYTGHKYDAETGLYQCGQRYYHPTLGRWTTRDPIGYADGMSLYEYVGSCPVVRLDASGLVWTAAQCKAYFDSGEQAQTVKLAKFVANTIVNRIEFNIMIIHLLIRDNENEINRIVREKRKEFKGSGYYYGVYWDINQLINPLIDENLMYAEHAHFMSTKLVVAKRARKKVTESYRFFRFMVKHGCDCCLSRKSAEDDKLTRGMINAFKKFGTLLNILDKLQVDVPFGDMTQALSNLDKLEELLTGGAIAGTVLVDARNAGDMGMYNCVPLVKSANCWVDAVHDSGEPKKLRERFNPGHYGY